MELVSELIEDLYFARAMRDAQTRVAIAYANLLLHDADRGETHTYSSDDEFSFIYTQTYSDLQDLLCSAVRELSQAGEAWHSWRLAWYRICP